MMMTISRWSGDENNNSWIHKAFNSEAMKTHKNSKKYKLELNIKEEWNGKYDILSIEGVGNVI